MKANVLFLGLLLHPAACLVAQQTWTVSASTVNPADFADLPQAVAAASPGDRIFMDLTLPSGWHGYSAATIDKPLEIMGCDTFQVSTSAQPTRATMMGLLRVENIGIGQSVVISNLSFADPAGVLPSPIPWGVEVENCAGRVVLEDIDAYGFLTAPIMNVVSCSNLILRGCTIALLGSPMSVTNSAVMFTTTRLYWDGPCVSQTLNYLQNTPSIVVHDSAVTLVDSVVDGPPAWQPCSGIPFYAEEAFRLSNSTLNIGAGATVRGGNTGYGYVWACSSVNPASCTINRDPRSVVGGTTYPSTTPMDIHATWHAWVVADRPFSLSVAGPPGGFALMAFGDLAPTSLPTQWGPLAIEPSTIQILDLVALSSTTGSHVWTGFCPATMPSGPAFVFQALWLSPAGQFGLTLPSPMTVGWPYQVIP